VDEQRERGEGSSWTSPEHPSFVHYLIARREATGFEAPHICFRCGEGVLPVFCSREAARRFLASRALGEGWYVRGFSVGELISLLFALHERVAWVMFSPLPGHLLIEDALSHLMSRDSFIESLLMR
jgi:hypothetical protein